MRFEFSPAELIARLESVGLAPGWVNLSNQMDLGQLKCLNLCTDTRKIQQGDLFVTLKGDHFNGNDFVAQALEKGAIAALVDEYRDTYQTLNAPVIQCRDGLQALAQIALWQREAFNGPLISITGSAGKTSTKQLMASVLAEQFDTWMTQGNLNNHIGVPLTLLAMAPQHQAAVVESGASGAGEIAATVSLAQPTVGIITNAAAAHLEGFGSLQGVVETKGELIDYVQPGGTVVLNADDAAFVQWQARAARRDIQVLCFGIEQSADVYATEISTSLGASEFVLNAAGAAVSATCAQAPFRLRVRLPLSGQHNIMNALAVTAAALAVGMIPEKIVSGLEKALAVSGRLETLAGWSGQKIINDSYNANPASFRAAIDVISHASEAWLVTGDMGELGNEAHNAHMEVGQYARTQGVRVLASTGPLSRSTVEAFGQQGYWFEDQASLVEFIKKEAPDQAVILVKGSRSAAMDKVVQALTVHSGDN